MARNKNRNKETSVSDVENKEELQTSEETSEETGGNDQSHGGNEGAEGVEGSAGDDTGSTDGEDPDLTKAESSVTGGESTPVLDEKTPVEETTAEPARGQLPGFLAVDEPAFAQDTAELASAAGLAPLIATLPAADAPLYVAPRNDKVDALVGWVREYVENMNPALHMDAKVGVKHQLRFYRMLSEITKLDFIDFKAAMDEVLRIVYEYRAAAFSDLHSRRFFESLYPQITHAQVREFDDLLSIIVTVGSSTNRKRAMSQIDLTAGLRGIKDAKAHQNLSGYFAALR